VSGADLVGIIFGLLVLLGGALFFVAILIVNFWDDANDEATKEETNAQRSTPNAQRSRGAFANHGCE
jgi:hypothetical protein